MSDTVIRVENLSKRYFITHQTRTTRAHGSHLTEKIQQWVSHPVRRILGRKSDALDGGKMKREEFWALKDVSFEVKRGDVLGVIGRNGAGKSTLLKILSRITEPTRGEIKVKGRIASLLEVGTGFHPELTGRENIFLNGSTLGMSRGEIQSKFDEIVAFAEVEKFLDTQVKHYSSGMYVRLAFAVAAHLEPEILIVDEVLAVGDAQFQKKCLGKMQAVAENGRTILFVSHNLTAVRRLTTSCLVLNQGNVSHVGDTSEAITHYLEMGDAVQSIGNRPRAASCIEGARFVDIRLCEQTTRCYANAPITFDVDIEWMRSIKNARFSMTIFNQEELPVASGFTPAEISVSDPKRQTLKLTIPKSTAFAPGRYHCTVAIGLPSANLDVVTNVLPFEVVASSIEHEAIPNQWHSEWGAIQLPVINISYQ